MKTLYEIISREDYKSINTALIQRSVEIADIIKTKMMQLDIEKLSSGGFTVYVVPIKVENIQTFNYLCIRHEEYNEYFAESHYEWRPLNRIDGFYSKTNWVCPASSSEKLQFLNHARGLLQSLDEIEDKKCEEIQKALNDTADLIKGE